MKLLLSILLFSCLSYSQVFYNTKFKVNVDGCMDFQCGCGNWFASKVIQIGDWDMVAKDTIRVIHNLTFDNIIGVSFCSVRNDDNTIKYMAMGHDGATTDVQINQITTTYIVLKRSVTGTFNSTDFNATSYNRGFIYVLYKK